MKKEINTIIKNHPFISIFATLITILQILPVGTYKLLNAATYEPVNNFKLITPVLKFILEPFIGIPIYLSTNHYIRETVIAMFLWGMFIIISYSIFKKRYSRLFIYTIIYIVGFSLFIIYVTFTPFPLLKAVSLDNNFCLIDTHSHTFYSHDGLVTPVQNSEWHKKQGFTGWFVADHYNIQNSMAEQSITTTNYYHSMVGEEIRAGNDRSSFLALGISNPLTSGDTTTVRTLAQAVHKQGGALVLEPLKGTTDILHDINDGIDAIEIANAGQKENIPASFRNEVYQVAYKQFHIPLLSSSNWHGWGNYAYTWTAFRIPGAKDYSSHELQHIVISMIRNKQSDDIIPIIYDYPYQYYGSVRFIFAPLFDFYYYFSTLPFQGYISWILWILLFLVLSIVVRHYRNIFTYKPVFLIYGVLILGGLMGFYYAIRMTIRSSFIPAVNTLLLKVIHILLLYSISILVITTLLIILTIRKKRGV